MKKSILLNYAVFLLFVKTVFGQGGNPGNGSISGNFLGWDGTGFAQPLQIRNDFNEPINFFTNNFQRMRIDTNGNVGIGTATPSHTLDVNGTVAAKQILIEEKDILALLSELQAQIAELKKQFTIIKN